MSLAHNPVALLLSRSPLIKPRRPIVTRAASRPRSWRRLTVYRPPMTVVGLRLKTRRRLVKKERGLVKTDAGVVGELKEGDERALVVIRAGCGFSANERGSRPFSGSEIQRLDDEVDEIEEGELLPEGLLRLGA